MPDLPAKSAEQAYPITQSELLEYRQLDHQIRHKAEILAGWRQSLISRMTGGHDLVEPGPLTVQIAYRDTGQFTQTDEGRVPVLQRHLLVIDHP